MAQQFGGINFTYADLVLIDEIVSVAPNIISHNNFELIIFFEKYKFLLIIIYCCPAIK